MVFKFTEKEKEYLIIGKGEWSIKQECPAQIRESLQRKLNAMTGEAKNRRVEMQKNELSIHKP